MSSVVTMIAQLMNGGWSVTPHGRGAIIRRARQKLDVGAVAQHIDGAIERLADPVLLADIAAERDQRLSHVSIAAAAEDRNADIVEGGGDRGVRLVDGDADGGDLLETVEHGLGDGAGGGLHQAIALGAERLARDIDHLIVADGVGELVGARGLASDRCRARDRA